MKYRIIISIFIAFSFISIAMVLFTKSMQDSLIQRSAIQNAENYSNAITAFRTVYTSEVVSRADKLGVEVRHDYHNKKAIPLPVTLSIILGKRIKENNSGVSVNIYSPYPFPWRKDTGGLKDEYSKKAWAFFLKTPNDNYYEFYTQNNKKFLRYSVADIMRDNCVECHNKRPDTPKSDWEVGDVRGIMDIKIPMDNIASDNNYAFNITIMIYCFLTVLAFIGIMLMLARHKAEATILENAVVIRTKELELEKANAIKANQAKSEFLSRMSHELKTPMNSVLGFAQLLEQDKNQFSQTQVENINDILNSGHQLLNLINALLDLNNIETGNLVANIEKVKIDDIIADCFIAIKSPCEAKSINVTNNISNKGYVVRADFALLKQILLNLLSNAIKYNPVNGSIILNAVVTDKNYLRISIADTGIGIDRSEINKLFTYFERLDKTNNVEGTGIGLVLSKQMVELIGGTIGFESPTKKGATFWIEIEIYDT